MKLSIARDHNGVWLRLCSALTLSLLCLSGVRAQQTLSAPKVEAKVFTGVSTFGNALNGDLRHTVVGGAMRFYVTRRLSIEPEFMHMRRDAQDRDYVFTPHVAFDLTDPRGRFVPYVIAGVGVEHHRDEFTFPDFFNGNRPVTRKVSSNTWSANAGGGVKLFLTDRLFVAPDVRVGREPNFRATISVGYVFSGRKR